MRPHTWQQQQQQQVPAKRQTRQLAVSAAPQGCMSVPGPEQAAQPPGNGQDHEEGEGHAEGEAAGEAAIAVVLEADAGGPAVNAAP